MGKIPKNVLSGYFYVLSLTMLRINVLPFINLQKTTTTTTKI